MMSFRAQLYLAVLTWALLSTVSTVAAADPNESWIHPKCFQLPSDKLGPFVRLADGAVLAIDQNQVIVSREEGAPIGRIFRNMAVINTHPALQLDRTAINAARTRFGLAPMVVPARPAHE